jgi:hypothetical protein
VGSLASDRLPVVSARCGAGLSTLSGLTTVTVLDTVVADMDRTTGSRQSSRPGTLVVMADRVSLPPMS